MVNAFIFLIHFVFVVFVLYKISKTENMGNAILNLILIVVLFTVGWSFISFILKLFLPTQGFGKEFDRDTISLTLLTIVEFFFYKSYYAPLFTSSGKEKQ